MPHKKKQSKNYDMATKNNDGLHAHVLRGSMAEIVQIAEERARVSRTNAILDLYEAYAQANTWGPGLLQGRIEKTLNQVLSGSEGDLAAMLSHRLLGFLEGQELLEPDFLDSELREAYEMGEDSFLAVLKDRAIGEVSRPIFVTVTEKELDDDTTGVYVEPAAAVRELLRQGFRPGTLELDSTGEMLPKARVAHSDVLFTPESLLRVVQPMTEEYDINVRVKHEEDAPVFDAVTFWTAVETLARIADGCDQDLRIRVPIADREFVIETTAAPETWQSAFRIAEVADTYRSNMGETPLNFHQRGADLVHRFAEMRLGAVALEWLPVLSIPTRAGL